MASSSPKYWTDYIFSPRFCEPPDPEWTDERKYYDQWFRAIFFHYLKMIALWSSFGILPFYWIPWNPETCLYLQILPWIFCGLYLNRKILPHLQLHHMVNMQEFSAYKIKGLFLWIWVYAELAVAFWTMAVL